MKTRLPLALALAASLGATAFLAVRADAQQTPPPAADQRGPGPGGPGGPGPDRMGPRGDMMRRGGSPEDRAAFLDARMAAVKAGLRLTPDQDKLWPPLEQAVRDQIAKISELRRARLDQPRPSDPIEAMRRRADDLTARGEAMRKVVDAAAPLYASLNDEQKRRLPRLMQLGGGEGGPRGMRERMRDRRGEWEDHHPMRQHFGMRKDFDDFAFGPSNDRRR